jgi:hypothetical protein
MPAPALHLGAVVMCSHAGSATPLVTFPRVLLSGQPVVTTLSPYTIAGCGLTGSGSPICVLGLWSSGAARVLAGGAPVATMAGSSSCLLTGSPMLPLSAQVRVSVT